MKTIETELEKYRMCRAEIARGCRILCVGCPNNLPGSLMHLFCDIDSKVGDGTT